MKKAITLQPWQDRIRTALVLIYQETKDKPAILPAAKIMHSIKLNYSAFLKALIISGILNTDNKPRYKYIPTTPPSDSLVYYFTLLYRVITADLIFSTPQIPECIKVAGGSSRSYKTTLSHMLMLYKNYGKRSPDTHTKEITRLDKIHLCPLKSLEQLGYISRSDRNHTNIKWLKNEPTLYDAHIVSLYTVIRREVDRKTFVNISIKNQMPKSKGISAYDSATQVINDMVKKTNTAMAEYYANKDRVNNSLTHEKPKLGLIRRFIKWIW
jgi:hypothetical protein